MPEQRPSVPCPGHVPACTHNTGWFACGACVRARKESGPLFCPDLDNCGGPGAMDPAPAQSEPQAHVCGLGRGHEWTCVHPSHSEQS